MAKLQLSLRKFGERKLIDSISMATSDECCCIKASITVVVMFTFEYEIVMAMMHLVDDEWSHKKSRVSTPVLTTI